MNNPIDIHAQMPEKGHETGEIRLQVRAMLQELRRTKQSTKPASDAAAKTSGGDSSKYATLMKKLVKIEKLIKKEKKSSDSKELEKLKRKKKEYQEALKETDEYKQEIAKQERLKEEAATKPVVVVKQVDDDVVAKQERDDDEWTKQKELEKQKRAEELERLRQREKDIADELERLRQRRLEAGEEEEEGEGELEEEAPKQEEDDQGVESYDDIDEQEDEQLLAEEDDEEEDELSLTADTEGMEDSYTSLWASVNDMRPDGRSFSNLGGDNIKSPESIPRRSYTIKRHVEEVVSDGEQDDDDDGDDDDDQKEEVVDNMWKSAPNLRPEGTFSPNQTKDMRRSWKIKNELPSIPTEDEDDEEDDDDDGEDEVQEENENVVEERDGDDDYVPQYNVVDYETSKPSVDEEGSMEELEEAPMSPKKAVTIVDMVSDDEEEDAAAQTDAADENSEEQSLQDEDVEESTVDHDTKAKMWMSMPQLTAEEDGLFSAGSLNARRLARELELVRNRQTKLELQLIQNGLPVSEEIPYDVAKSKIAELSDEMETIREQMEEDEDGTSSRSGEEQAEISYRYYQLEEEMEKYSVALALTDEYAEEQLEQEAQWEEEIHDENMIALKRLRRHMPVNIRYVSEEELATKIPKELARKFKRTNILQLLRVDPDVIEKMHPSLLEALRTTGLTLTERRALYEHLKHLGNKWQTARMDKATDRKWTWHESLKTKFRECLEEYEAHMEEYGEAGCHDCPFVGTQCPLEADLAFDYFGDFGFTDKAEYEESGTPAQCPVVEGVPSSKFMMTSSMGSPSPSASYNTRSSKGPTLSEAEIRVIVCQRAGTKEPVSGSDKKLIDDLVHAERRALNLEKQLMQAGVTVIAKEDIPYVIAKAKSEELAEDIQELGTTIASTSDPKGVSRLEKEYLQLSRELEKYTNALMLSKEWATEQQEKERTWETSILDDNIKALKQLRRHMPVNIREMGEIRLSTEPTPNGKTLPKAMARKFKRTSILTLIRMDPIREIEPMHPSSLEALGQIGLTLTERRALHEHLKELGPKWKSGSSDKTTERKRVWYESLQSKFKEQLAEYQHHVDKFHSHASEGKCKLKGSQCPVTANTMTDYSGDYGFTEEAEYGEYEVQKSNLLTVEDFIARSVTRSNSSTQLDGLMAEISARS